MNRTLECSSRPTKSVISVQHCFSWFLGLLAALCCNLSFAQSTDERQETARITFGVYQSYISNLNGNAAANLDLFSTADAPVIGIARECRLDKMWVKSAAQAVSEGQQPGSSAKVDLSGQEACVSTKLSCIRSLTKTREGITENFFVFAKDKTKYKIAALTFETSKDGIIHHPSGDTATSATSPFDLVRSYIKNLNGNVGANRACFANDSVPVVGIPGESGTSQMWVKTASQAITEEQQSGGGAKLTIDKLEEMGFNVVSDMDGISVVCHTDRVSSNMIFIMRREDNSWKIVSLVFQTDLR